MPKFGMTFKSYLDAKDMVAALEKSYFDKTFSIKKGYDGYWIDMEDKPKQKQSTDLVVRTGKFDLLKDEPETIEGEFVEVPNGNSGGSSGGNSGGSGGTGGGSDSYNNSSSSRNNQPPPRRQSPFMRMIRSEKGRTFTPEGVGKGIKKVQGFIKKGINPMPPGATMYTVREEAEIYKNYLHRRGYEDAYVKSVERDINGKTVVIGYAVVRKSKRLMEKTGNKIAEAKIPKRYLERKVPSQTLSSDTVSGWKSGYQVTGAKAIRRDIKGRIIKEEQTETQESIIPTPFGHDENRYFGFGMREDDS